jgi:DNA-binding MarR family transcriptional regulator
MQGRRDAEIVRLVFDLTDHLQHRYEAVAAEHGLTRQQASLLGLLDEPRPMSTLATLLQRDASNITGLVDRLERQDLVRRERDERDRRVTLVALTDGGKDLHARFETALYGSGLPFSALSEDERATLLGLLSRVV